MADGSIVQHSYVFYRSVNGVWLVKEVPTGYLELSEKEKMI